MAVEPSSESPRAGSPHSWFQARPHAAERNRFVIKRWLEVIAPCSGNLRGAAGGRERGTWSVVLTPNPSGATSASAGVSCSSPWACVAVGSLSDSSGRTAALAEHWNGTRWFIMCAPTPAAQPAAPSRACRASGRLPARLSARTPTAWEDMRSSSAEYRRVVNPARSQHLRMRSIVHIWTSMHRHRWRPDRALERHGVDDTDCACSQRHTVAPWTVSMPDSWRVRCSRFAEPFGASPSATVRSAGFSNRTASVSKASSRVPVIVRRCVLRGSERLCRCRHVRLQLRPPKTMGRGLDGKRGRSSPPTPRGVPGSAECRVRPSGRAWPRSYFVAEGPTLTWPTTNGQHRLSSSSDPLRRRAWQELDQPACVLWHSDSGGQHWRSQVK